MKKFISSILSIAILITLMPAAFAGETTAIEYKFTRAAVGSSSSISGSDVLGEKTMANNYNKWYVEGVNQAYEVTIMKSSFCWTSSTNRVSGEEQSNYHLSAAIVLDVAETGTFIPSLKYLPKTNAPIYDVYMTRKNNSDDVSGFTSNSENAKLKSYINVLTDAQYLGKVDMCGSEDDSTATFSTVNITEPGDYYLIFVDDGVSENWSLGSASLAYTYITSFTLTPAGTQEDIISSFELDDSVEAAHSPVMQTPLVAALDGREISASVSATDTDGDGVYEVTAGDTDETGKYTFLYWIKGLTQDKTNKIVSLTSTIEEYKPQNGANYLIAVYEKKGAETEAKAEFYDGNGQLLYTTEADDIDENNVAVADGVITLPALPQMANYTSATHWQLYGDATNKKYDAGETETLSGRMIFVAQYDDVNVTVNGKEVRYGDSVTFTANADAEGSYFKWWTRTVNGVTEIVSTDRTYTFCPWENCTVSAVYGDTKQIMAGNLRKIIIDVLENDAIMAEFIGLDGAEVVEKGIKLGDKKIAMSTNAFQFTITNNISATSASGYAIIKDGDTVTEITDGTISPLE